MKTSFALSALVATVAALPTALKPKICPAVPQNANFDDLRGLPGSIFNSIPTPYKGLLFQGAQYTSVLRTSPLLGTGLVPGVAPNSGNNYAGIQVVSQLSGTPMLTVNYASSNIESFQLDSFYFGCVIQLANGVTAIPSACKINVTGYKGTDNNVAAGQQVCSQSYSYTPASALGRQQQTFGRFSNCAGKDIQYAVVQFDLEGAAGALDVLSGLVLDDVKYSTKAKKC
ncbi:hypothetical protein OPT61_g5179 [Boeremia exigua]|uniref:Uncharacterized protein n=1 Tax=Boeremia exigua TaxID=749465 RepID=A0ACC2IBG5_9PLEO|nr:hypothetical protein OPT61_g5179 [Boeremia exigua]